MIANDEAHFSTQLILRGIFACCCCLSAMSSATAGELSQDIQSLSVASAKLHYQNHVLSKLDRTKATVECYALKESPVDVVRRAAEELFPLLEEVVPLELARLRSGMSPRDQAANRDQAMIELILGTTEYIEVIGKQVEIATNFARANDRLLDLEAMRTAVWQERIKPTVEQHAGVETPLEKTLEVKFGILSRDIWISVKNISGKDLHSCSFATVTHQRDKPDLYGIWFFPKLKHGETIVTEPFHSWALPRKLGDEFAVQPDLSVDFSFFSNECRVSDENAESVNGYTIRDPFMQNLVSTGRTYVSSSDAAKKRICFQTVKPSNRHGRSGAQVTFTIESDGGKKKESFIGSWDEDRTFYRGFHPGTLQIVVRPNSDATGSIRKAETSGQFGTLFWIDGRFSLMGLFGEGYDFWPDESSSLLPDTSESP